MVTLLKTLLIFFPPKIIIFPQTNFSRQKLSLYSSSNFSRQKLIFFLGFPKEAAAQIALGTIREWLEENHDRVDRIIFCMFADDEEEIYQELLPSYFPRNKDNVTFVD
jgi:ADP-heptose:LPS heptosyltransferase